MIFGMLSRAYYRLFGSNKLNGAETLCLKSLRENITPGARAILDQQLAKVQLVQRQGVRTCFYYPVGDESIPRFAGEKEGAIAASIWLEARGFTEGTIQSDVSLHNGRMFMMEFFHGTGKGIRSSDLTPYPLVVKRTVILSDQLSATKYV